MTKSLQITIFSRELVRQTIDWPILDRRPKAILVETPGGKLWLPLWKLGSLRYRVDQIDALMQLLERIAGSDFGARIRVWKAGAGPTMKSHKYQVAVIKSAVQHGEEVRELQRRTFTLPVSQITADGRNFMAPVWLLRKKLAKGEALPRGTWPGLPAIREQIDAAVGRIHTIEQEAVDRRAAWERARAEKAREEAVRLTELQAKVARDGEGALRFVKLRFKRSDVTIDKLRNQSLPKWPINMGNLFALLDVGAVIDFANAQASFQEWRRKNAKRFPKITVPFSDPPQPRTAVTAEHSHA